MKALFFETIISASFLCLYCLYHDIVAKDPSEKSFLRVLYYPMRGVWLLGSSLSVVVGVASIVTQSHFFVVSLVFLVIFTVGSGLIGTSILLLVVCLYRVANSGALRAWARIPTVLLMAIGVGIMWRAVAVKLDPYQADLVREPDTKIGSNLPQSGVTKYKPVIYLYPPAQMSVTTRLKYKGELTVTYPKYNAQIEGWQVIAHPDGKILTSDGHEYS